MYVLDTNVISELRKATGGRADIQVTRWIIGVPPSNLYISVITIFELELGALRLRRHDLKQSAILRGWIDNYILPNFGNRIFPVTTAVAQLAASLHVPDPRPERDVLIAATALVHRMTVVTRNVSDFKPMGVPVINPWEP